MPTPLRFLRRAEDVLSIMRESPSTRQLITTAKKDIAGRPVRAVADVQDEPGAVPVLLAYLAANSEAEGLFMDAMRADATHGAAEAWARLPLRYHAFYSACLLPDHPDAPRKPGGLANDMHQAAMGNAGHSLTTRRATPKAVFAEDLSPEEVAEIEREAFEDYDASMACLAKFDDDGPDDFPF
jgi:hypothetical protein